VKKNKIRRQRAMVKSPVLPYDGGTSSGHSGSDTSHERALHLDRSGKTQHYQQEAMIFALNHAADGITWFELADHLGTGHGTASGVLSNLHKAGRLDRLSVKRGKSKVYVMPQFVNGRITEMHGRKPVVHECPDCGCRF
jgi:hypothetical protein